MSNKKLLCVSSQQRIDFFYKIEPNYHNSNYLAQLFLKNMSTNYLTVKTTTLNYEPH
jgi:hypothetical protein